MLTIVCARYNSFIWRIKRLLSCFVLPISYSLSPSIPLEKFCWWLLGLLRMPAWPGKVSGIQRRDTIPEGSGKGKRGAYRDSAVLFFSQQRINAVAITDSNNMMPSTPVTGNERRCVQSKLFPAQLQSPCTQSTQLLQRGLNQNNGCDVAGFCAGVFSSWCQTRETPL